MHSCFSFGQLFHHHQSGFTNPYYLTDTPLWPFQSQVPVHKIK
jgi:hypothetical protein